MDIRLNNYIFCINNNSVKVNNIFVGGKTSSNTYMKGW